MKEQKTINAYFNQVIKDNWDSESLTNFKGSTYMFSDIGLIIAQFHILFEAGGIKSGDKIAIIGQNNAEWLISFISAMTYGAVVVPILSDFKPDTLHHLINHSDAKVMFTNSSIWKTLNEKDIPDLKFVCCLDDYTPLLHIDDNPVTLLMSRNKKVTTAAKDMNLLFHKLYPNGLRASDLKLVHVAPEDTVLINYTAGSTGFSKGVMLSEHALWSNIQFCIDKLTFLHPGDPIVSLLPLAHMYGLVIEALHPFIKGCHIYLLNRTPAPKILLEAFAFVKPKLIISVPLVLEKIIKTRVFPKLRKPSMRLMLTIPIISGVILRKIRETLIEAFGGNLKEIIIGGAALAHEVEDFLRRINFPVTVGYGMTECGPLISYWPHETQRVSSCGRVVDRMEARVDSPDPEKQPGILWVRGDNVMKGYYKNEDATKSIIKDGWMNTGDICQMDRNGFIYIRGRDKNMILGPSGQNIYPEEMEAVLNESDLVAESLIVENKSKLIALIVPNYDNLKAKGINTDDQLQPVFKELIVNSNKVLPSYSQISDFKIRNEEFEKTPKRSIKRYLYQSIDK